MKHFVSRVARLLVCGVLLCSCGGSPSPGEPLARQLHALEHRADLIGDANDVKRLQRAYGRIVTRPEAFNA